MQEVTVKYGKPVVKLPFHTLRLIGLFDILVNAISAIYIFELFSLAVHIQNKYGQYVELLKENTSSLSVLLAIAGLIILPFNILTIFTIYKVFHTARKRYGLFLRICWILSTSSIPVLLIFIIAGLSMGAPPDASKLQNLLNSMTNYSDDSLLKSKIDRMQVEFQCCGANNYTDWYTIEWFDKNFIKKTDYSVVGEAPFSCYNFHSNFPCIHHVIEGASVVGEAPFSCCNFHSNFPCIHHGIDQGAGAYKYTSEANFSLSSTGCYESMQGKKLRTIWTIVGYIFALVFLQGVAFVPTRLIQTAYVGRGKMVNDHHMYTCWIIGWFKGVKSEPQEAPPVPPVPPELLITFN